MIKYIISNIQCCVNIRVLFLGYAVKSNQLTSGSRILSETGLTCVLQK